MSAAVCKGNDVVYLLCGSHPSLCAALLAQRVGSHEAVADAPPQPAVSFSHGRVALLLFIPPCFLLGMGFAESIVC